jgi:hypothetical protein
MKQKSPTGVFSRAWGLDISSGLHRFAIAPLKLGDALYHDVTFSVKVDHMCCTTVAISRADGNTMAAGDGFGCRFLALPCNFTTLEPEPGILYLRESMLRLKARA